MVKSKHTGHVNSLNLPVDLSLIRDECTGNLHTAPFIQEEIVINQVDSFHVTNITCPENALKRFFNVERSKAIKAGLACMITVTAFILASS